MGHAGSTNYSARAKQGFLIGAALFAVGVLGEYAGRAFVGGLPGWQQALLFDAEVLGLLIALLAPLVFAIVLPLVE